MDMILIGNRIKKAREEKGITQMKLAELVGLSTIAISNIEIGKSFPNFKNIIFIADVLDVSIDSIVATEHSHQCEEHMQQIILKLKRLDEIGLKHINRYIDLYNETIKEK